MGSHEEEPPPIAPYPFWQSGPPRRTPVTTEAPPRPPAPAPDDPEDLPTVAHDVLADDDAPTQAHPAVPSAPPQSRRARRLQRETGPAAGGGPLTLPPDEDLEVRLEDGTSLTPASAELLQDLHAEEKPLRRERRTEGDRAPNQAMLASAGAGLVVIVIALVIALTGGGGEEDPADPPAEAAPSPAAVAFPVGEAPKDLAPLDEAAAKQVLAQAKAETPGTVVEAYRWTDDNGLNAVVTTTEKTSDGTTLRVVQVAGEEGKARELRSMRDPDLPTCSGGDASAGFTPKALAVRDIDADGVSEVVVGWSSRCGGETAESAVRLALLSSGDKYIIRGDGVIGRTGEGNSAPDPAASRWPDGFLSALTTYFRSLYY